MEIHKFSLLGMDILLICKVRGLNVPNKQKEVKLFCNKHEAGLIGLLETKIKSNKIEKISKSMFNGWKFITNLEMHYNGRIWLTWRSDYFQVILRTMNAQAITCEVHDIIQ